MVTDKKNGGVSLGLLSKYRPVVMGAAILMTMFCHLNIAQKHNGVSVTQLASIMQTFTVGVDIFFFYSGIGLYYSFTNHRMKYLAFEIKRVKRIVPTYLIVAGITYFLYDVLIKHLGMKRLLLDISFASWPMFGSTRYWYILAAIVFYFIFPVANRLINREGGKLFPLLLFCILWWITGETLCIKYSEIDTFRLAISRLPIFLMGIYSGEKTYHNVPIKNRQLIILASLGYVALIILKTAIPNPYYQYLYYPIRGLLALSIIASLILVMELFERKIPKTTSMLNEILSWFGHFTLELYLLHQSFLILFEYPCKLSSYIVTAFILPTAVTVALFIVRKRCRKAKRV